MDRSDLLDKLEYDAVAVDSWKDKLMAQVEDLIHLVIALHLSGYIIQFKS